MKKFIFSILILNTIINANLKFPKSINYIIEDIINAKYNDANEKIEKNIKNKAIYYLLKASVIQTKMMDYEDYSDEEIFISYLDSCEKYTQKYYKTNSPEYNYLMGTIYGYIGSHYGKKKSFLKAFKYGRKGIYFLKECIKIDSSFYDAYLGIGIYNYWFSKKIGILKIFPGLEDNSREGIKEIKIAAQSGILTKYPAINMLAWVYINEDSLKKAKILIDSLINQFPESRTFYWTRIEYAKKIKNSLLLEKTLRKLLKLIYAAPNNHINESICLYQLGDLYAKELNIKKLQNLFYNKILKLPLKLQKKDKNKYYIKILKNQIN